MGSNENSTETMPWSKPGETAGIKRNRDEWTRIYVLLKLLHDGSVPLGTLDLAENWETRRIIGIEWGSPDACTAFRMDETDDTVEILHGSSKKKVPRSEFERYAETLLKNIKSAKRPSYAIPEITPFLDKIGIIP